MTAANPGDGNFLLTDPQVWIRTETTGDRSQPEERAAYVKLLFLAWLHQQILASLSERPKEPFDERLEQMLGPEPFTPSAFDEWWGLERFDETSDVENVEHLIAVESLRKVAAPESVFVRKHLDFVLNTKSGNAKKSN